MNARAIARRLMSSAFTILLGVAFGLSILLFLAQDRMIFLRQPPPAEKPQASGLAIGDVEIDVGEGLRLRGWIARPVSVAPAERLPLAIYFGGNAEEVSGMATLAGRFPGWALLAVNYRGYGGNPGDPSEKALFGDALALYDWAARREDVDPRSIAAVGRSLGSGVAVYLAAERPVSGVVLVTPYDSLRAVAQRHYPYAPVSLLLRHPFDSVSRAGRVAAPMLLLAAERDSVVPVSHARALFEKWGGPKTWREIPRADHNDLDAEPAYWEELAAFLTGLGGHRTGTGAERRLH
jgi:pimeloyl-ACP methyl ester carboxylesterase